jgi:hypothetical protein
LVSEVLIWILRGLADSATGITSVSTPSSYLASMRSASRLSPGGDSVVIRLTRVTAEAHAELLARDGWTAEVVDVQTEEGGMSGDG